MPHTVPDMQAWEMCDMLWARKIFLGSTGRTGIWRRATVKHKGARGPLCWDSGRQSLSTDVATFHFTFNTHSKRIMTTGLILPVSSQIQGTWLHPVLGTLCSQLLSRETRNLIRSTSCKGSSGWQSQREMPIPKRDAHPRERCPYRRCPHPARDISGRY